MEEILPTKKTSICIIMRISYYKIIYTYKIKYRQKIKICKNILEIMKIIDFNVFIDLNTRLLGFEAENILLR